jgi:hypothetical protein
MERRSLEFKGCRHGSPWNLITADRGTAPLSGADRKDPSLYLILS